MSDDDLTIIGQRIGYGDYPADLFGISRADRRRHLFVEGQTGSGKSTLLANMILQDIARGDGVCLIDPLGQTAELVLERIPPWHTNHVRVFDVADLSWPLGLNVLAGHGPDHRHRAVAAAVDAFASVWDLSLSRTPQLLDILGYGIAALMEIPDATLLHLPRFLTDDDYRERCLQRLTDRYVRDYWQSDFGTRGKRERREACSSVLNKLGELRRDPVMRNIFGQSRNAIDAPFMLQNRSIMIANLAIGEIGRENARLIGAFLISQFALAAAARAQAIAGSAGAGIAVHPDFYLYLEEFGDLVTPGFGPLLSQSRAGRVSVSCFTQHQAQLPAGVLDAVFGNIGNLVAFRVGAEDAERLAREFDHSFVPGELTGLREHEIAVKLPKRAGNPPYPFRAFTLPLQAPWFGRRRTIVEQSRIKYGREREKVERSIARIIAPATPASRPRSSTRARTRRPGEAVRGL